MTTPMGLGMLVTNSFIKGNQFRTKLLHPLSSIEEHVKGGHLGSYHNVSCPCDVVGQVASHVLPTILGVQIWVLTQGLSASD